MRYIENINTKQTEHTLMHQGEVTTREKHRTENNKVFMLQDAPRQQPFLDI